MVTRKNKRSKLNGNGGDLEEASTTHPTSASVEWDEQKINELVNRRVEAVLRERESSKRPRSPEEEDKVEASTGPSQEESVRKQPSQLSHSESAMMSVIWEELKRLRQQVDGRPSQAPQGVPLTHAILDEELPTNFQQPTIKDYDGSSDPQEHLSRFANTALLHRYSDNIKCRVFLTTLVGPTLQWFNSLPCHSITSFDEFSRIFLNRFSSSKSYRKTSISLFGVKQKETEALRDYVHRFNLAMLDVPTATVDLLTTAFTEGLRPGGDFFKSLAKRPSNDFDSLLGRAEKFINLEDAQQLRGAEQRGGDKITPAERPAPS